MRNVLTLLCQIALVAIAVFLADIAQSNISFIPKSIIRLPAVDYTAGDFQIVFYYFVLVHAAVLCVSQMIYGLWTPAQSSRTANELYSLAAAFSLSALLVFTTTSVAFDPNFIVGIAVFTALEFLLVGFFTAASAKIRPLSYLLSLLQSLFRKAFTVSGVLILLFSLSPGILAKLFVSDRDVANVITQVRIYFSGGDDAQYQFVNALGGRTFSQPMLAKLSPVDSSRLYVLEREGRLVSVSYPRGGEYKVELEINDLVGTAEVENGALGFAFDRKNKQSLYVYIYYTVVSNDGQVNQLSRFDLSAKTMEAVKNSELPLISLPRETSGFHNGGSVEFGPDGYLYLALGEGVHPKAFTSREETLRSGVLRIDVNCFNPELSIPIPRQPAVGRTVNYCIPKDNPFVENEAVMAEYWAIGLRNPFRVSFDSLSGQLWAGDVGSTKWEEINQVEKGGNYQYPWVEGKEDTGRKKPQVIIGREIGPIYTYVHTAYDRAVIGGEVYRGETFPELTGKYLFADNYSSKLFSMDWSTPTPSVVHIATADQFAQRGTSSITTLANGDILLTTLGRSAVASGEVLRLVAETESFNGNESRPGKSTPAPTSYSLQEIRGIYVANCARCHGMKGKGKGPDTHALNVAVPDFTDPNFQSSRTDTQLVDVIKLGGYATKMSPMMPAWGHILDKEEVSGLVRWIRTL